MTLKVEKMEVEALNGDMSLSPHVVRWMWLDTDQVWWRVYHID